MCWICYLVIYWQPTHKMENLLGSHVVILNGKYAIKIKYTNWNRRKSNQIMFKLVHGSSTEYTASIISNGFIHGNIDLDKYFCALDFFIDARFLRRFFSRSALRDLSQVITWSYSLLLSIRGLNITKHVLFSRPTWKIKLVEFVQNFPERIYVLHNKL